MITDYIKGPDKVCPKAVSELLLFSVQTHVTLRRSDLSTASPAALFISHHIAPPSTFRKYGGTTPSRRRYLVGKNTRCKFILVLFFSSNPFLKEKYSIFHEERIP